MKECSTDCYNQIRLNPSTHLHWPKAHWRTSSAKGRVKRLAKGHRGGGVHHPITGRAHPAHLGPVHAAKWGGKASIAKLLA